jgi:hypothetical protein
MKPTISRVNVLIPVSAPASRIDGRGKAGRAMDPDIKADPLWLWCGVWRVAVLEADLGRSKPISADRSRSKPIEADQSRSKPISVTKQPWLNSATGATALAKKKPLPTQHQQNHHSCPMWKWNMLPGSTVHVSSSRLVPAGTPQRQLKDAPPQCQLAVSCMADCSFKLRGANTATDDRLQPLRRPWLRGASPVPYMSRSALLSPLGAVHSVLCC